VKKPSSRNFGRWFRFYEESLNDPKIITLTDRGFRTWVNLLSIASKSDGILPGMRDLSVYLRMTHNDVEDQLSDLINAGLIDILSDRSLTPHNWDKRQFKWDAKDPTTKDRSKRYRARKNTDDQPTETLRHGRVTVEVTETPSVSVSSVVLVDRDSGLSGKSDNLSTAESVAETVTLGQTTRVKP